MAPQKKTQAKATQNQSVPASAAPNVAEAKASSVSSPAKMDDEPKNDVKATPLICLNEATAKFGTWEVCVVKPKMQNYTYTWNGQERKGTNFRCTLVSTDDDTKYCLAEPGKYLRKGYERLSRRLPIANVAGCTSGQDQA